MSDTIFPEPMDQMDRAMQRMDKKAWAEVDAEIALLKAQLAEADALLREARAHLDNLGNKPDLKRRIDAHLAADSASGGA